MKTMILAVLAVVFLSDVAMSDDIVATNGLVYSDIKVLRNDPLRIFFTYTNEATGKLCATNILFGEMTEIDRQKYGYDQEKAEKALRQEQRQEAVNEVRKTRIAKPAVSDPSVSKVGGKAVLDPVSCDLGMVEIARIIDEGMIVRPVKFRSIRRPSDSMASVGGFLGGERKDLGVSGPPEYGSPVLIVGLPATLVDNDRWSGNVYPCGIFKYISTNGSGKTVRRYATSKAIALKLMQEEATQEGNKSAP